MIAFAMGDDHGTEPFLTLEESPSSVATVALSMSMFPQGRNARCCTTYAESKSTLFCSWPLRLLLLVAVADVSAEDLIGIIVPWTALEREMILHQEQNRKQYVKERTKSRWEMRIANTSIKMLRLMIIPSSHDCSGSGEKFCIASV